jgi:hypothetical protein
MKRIRFTHLFLAVLVVVVSFSGCRSAPPPAVTNNIDDLIRTAANLASKYADEALAAKIAAEAADGDELRLLMNQADEAALLAQKHADEAVSLQSQIDDLAVRNQVADDVLRAKQAADEAAAVNKIFLSLRKQIIQSSIDDITNRILQQVNYSGDAGEQQQSIKWLGDIVAGSFCDLLGDTVATGELPTQADVQDAVAQNAMNSTLDISGIYDLVSEELIEVFNQLASGKTVDELDRFKEACESALTER